MSGTVLSREHRSDYDVIALAGSAGALAGMARVLSDLPADLPAAVVVVQHRASVRRDFLPFLLGQRTRLAVKAAAEGDRLAPGIVYVGPPGRQVEIRRDGRLSVARSERVNFVCPSADVLFEGLARACGERAIGCVLSGRGTDGTEGVKAIRAAGGFVIAESESTAAYADMAASAVATRKVDLVLPIDEIGFALEVLVRGEALRAA